MSNKFSEKIHMKGKYLFTLSVTTLALLGMGITTTKNANAENLVDSETAKPAFEQYYNNKANKRVYIYNDSSNPINGKTISQLKDIYTSNDSTVKDVHDKLHETNILDISQIEENNDALNAHFTKKPYYYYGGIGLRYIDKNDNNKIMGYDAGFNNNNIIDSFNTYADAGIPQGYKLDKDSLSIFYSFSLNMEVTIVPDSNNNDNQQSTDSGKPDKHDDQQSADSGNSDKHDDQQSADSGNSDKHDNQQGADSGNSDKHDDQQSTDSGNSDKYDGQQNTVTSSNNSLTGTSTTNVSTNNTNNDNYNSRGNNTNLNQGTNFNDLPFNYENNQTNENINDKNSLKINKSKNDLKNAKNNLKNAKDKNSYKKAGKQLKHAKNELTKSTNLNNYKSNLKKLNKSINRTKDDKKLKEMKTQSKQLKNKINDINKLF